LDWRKRGFECISIFLLGLCGGRSPIFLGELRRILAFLIRADGNFGGLARSSSAGGNENPGNNVSYFVMKLAKNVGGIDKVLRLGIGAVAMGVGAYTGMWWLVGVGAIIFLTGLLGRCGLYYLIGVNTCSVEKR
jgi:hypothetical protein